RSEDLCWFFSAPVDSRPEARNKTPPGRQERLMKLGTNEPRTSAIRRCAMVVGVLALSAALAILTTEHAAVAATPNVIQARSAAAVTLPDAGATLQYVESVNLAKGSWTVTSNATAVNFGPGDYIRC